jgi:hypothetical protein
VPTTVIDAGSFDHVWAISVDLLRRDVGILFVSAVYCDANVWRYFLFGAIFVRLRRERQALLRAREPPSIRRSTIKPSIASTKRTFLQIGEEIMDDEMRREFSKLYDALIHVGAKNDFGWISLAFTVNYVLLGIILWRLFG